jgi:hypothetical protein
MDVGGQLHVPATLPTGTWPLVPIGSEAGWLTEYGLPLYIQILGRCID